MGDHDAGSVYPAVLMVAENQAVTGASVFPIDDPASRSAPLSASAPPGPVNMLWIGRSLGYIERLAMQ